MHMSPKTLQRRASPRIAVTLDLLLLRGKGGRVAARTLDIGAGGMCVTTDRPLGVDEVLRFDLSLRERHLDGQARVLRMQGHNVYALRFEELDETDRRLLTEVVGQTA
jgi:c-di-GMP-binding flagellar brake protein YcgR